jgi:phenylpropionate dioxygenase-like ring-hydroxylating dioxygenase large terminal subunit
MTEAMPRTRRWGSADDPESMITMAEFFATDTRPIPEPLLERSIRDDVPTDPVDKEVFVSPEYARKEFDKLWMHVWQSTCREREIPNAGDHYEYTIGDQSVIVVRGQDLQIRAFHNVCLHRGTKLVPGNGTAATEFSCSFHGWTWNLDGGLKSIPCRWDFPRVDDADYGLRELRVEAWNGFVFVNFDAEAPTLDEFLGETVPRHFETWPLSKKVKAAHVGKLINSNWKVALEAFLEVYHAFRTHPQTTAYASDANAQYDQYGLHGRMLNAMGVPSPHVTDDLDDQDIVEAMISDQVAAQFQPGQEPQIDFPQVGEGQTSRSVLAEWARGALNAVTGVDYSKAADTEMLDVIQYFVFPNLVPWGGASFPLTYRVRPHGSDPDWCLFEVMLFASLPEGVEPPADAPMRMLEPHQAWSDAPELGGLGPIADQDTANLQKVQDGLKSRGLTHVTFADVQERNIRQLHANIADYVERP